MTDATPATPVQPESQLPELPRDLRRAILAAFVLTNAASALGTAFLPYLITKRPLVLLLTSSDLRNIVLVASKIDLPLVALVAIPRRILAMFIVYGMGAIYGRALLAWGERKFPRLSKAFSFFERIFVKVSRPLVLLWPAYFTGGLAGLTRMPLRHFIPFMVVGQVGFVIVTYYVGDALARWTDWLLAFFARNLWESTAAFATAVGIQQLVSFVRRRRAARLKIEESAAR